MSNRLDKEREKELQPQRMQYAINEIGDRGLEITHQDETAIRFMYKGNEISFYPYSGWHQGKGIKPGRGLQNLLNQLNP